MFFDGAAQLGVLVQKAGRHRRCAGYGDECDWCVCILQSDDGASGSGFGVAAPRYGSRG